MSSTDEMQFRLLKKNDNEKFCWWFEELERIERKCGFKFSLGLFHAEFLNGAYGTERSKLFAGKRWIFNGNLNFTFLKMSKVFSPISISWTFFIVVQTIFKLQCYQTSGSILCFFFAFQFSRSVSIERLFKLIIHHPKFRSIMFFSDYSVFSIVSI